jgi:Na+-driven multidrug efflux pump
MQQYTYIDVIFLGPLFSFIGIVISIITRKTRKIHPALWISGIISCMLGFIVCMFVFSMLIGGLVCGLYMDWN